MPRTMVLELEKSGTDELICDVRTCNHAARYLIVWPHHDVKVTCARCCAQVSQREWFDVAILFG
jgi:hypothetical protein